MRVHKNLFGTEGQDKIHGDEIYFESGENSNGRYVKFPDGTMICTTSGNRVAPMTTVRGALYVENTAVTWTYPQQFSEAPSVSITSHSWGLLGAYADAPSKTGVAYRMIRHNSEPNPNIVYSIIAIGRWK